MLSYKTQSEQIRKNGPQLRVCILRMPPRVELSPARVPTGGSDDDFVIHQFS